MCGRPEPSGRSIPTENRTLTVQSAKVRLAAINSGGTNTLLRTAYVLVNATPLILVPTLNGDDFTFTFETVLGKTYLIEFKDSVGDSSWQTLQSVPGDGISKTITNSISTTSQRFFRLNVQ
jgi:hypothetical protein